MKRAAFGVFGLLLPSIAAAAAPDVVTIQPGQPLPLEGFSQTHAKPAPVKLRKAKRGETLLHRAERSGYKKVSSLVDFPPFFPGIGIVYVKPANLPVGPFLAFDRKNNLVGTIYMVPMEDMENHKKFDAAGALRPVDHVTIYFNGGHPGVDMPHYHIVNWHVSRTGEAAVAR
jgi:hypothetical protein